jgi:hypothetical protein
MITIKQRSGHRTSFLRFHSLSIAALGILLFWVVLYIRSDPNTHGGAFFGNAIADWSGSVVIIIATKYLFEKGSEESRFVKERKKKSWQYFLRCHSLTLFLLITGGLWTILYLRMNPMSKWGQVVGNIVSEWVQMLGLVLLTKKLIERGSRESHK